MSCYQKFPGVSLSVVLPVLAGVVSTIALNLLTTGAVQAAEYSFTKIADDSGPFYFFDPPVINDSGTVAFFSFLETDGQGIYISNGTTITTLVTTEGQLKGIESRIAINNNGTVAFLESYGGIYTTNGTIPTLIATPKGRFIDFGDNELDLAGISINNSGTLAFWGAPVGPSGVESQGIYTSNGTLPTALATTSGQGRFSFIDFFPDINNNGTVVFKADLYTGEEGIFTGNGTFPTPIVTSSGPFSSFQNKDPSINDSDTVVFWGLLDTGEQGIYTSNGTSLTPIVTNIGPFNSFGSPDINNSGTVAFSASLDTGEQGIFIGPNPVADKVIKTGDSLFGSTVAAVYFYKGLNNLGQIAFYAELANGVEVIGRADPVVTNSSSTTRQTTTNPASSNPLEGSVTQKDCPPGTILQFLPGGYACMKK